MIKKYFSILVILFLLSGCSVDLETYQEPSLTFDHLKDPIPVSVRSLTIRDETSKDFNIARTEYGFNNKPVDILTSLIRNRVKPAGGSDFLSFTIEESSIVETPIVPKDGFFALFNTQKYQEYEGTLIVYIERLTHQNATLLGHRIRVKRRMTLPHNATLVERQAFSFKMLESLVDDFDVKMTEILASHYR